jgi:hypothetical protein
VVVVDTQSVAATCGAARFSTDRADAILLREELLICSDGYPVPFLELIPQPLRLPFRGGVVSPSVRETRHLVNLRLHELGSLRDAPPQKFWEK